MARRRTTNPWKPYSSKVTQKQCDQETPHYGHRWSGPRGGQYQCTGWYKFVRSNPLVKDATIKPKYRHFLAPNGDVHAIHPLAEHKVYWDIKDSLSYGFGTPELLVVPLCVGNNALTEAQIVQAVRLLENPEEGFQYQAMMGNLVEVCPYCKEASKVWHARFGEGR